MATAVEPRVGLNVALAGPSPWATTGGTAPGDTPPRTPSHVLPGGYHRAVWRAEVVLTPLNLCRETLDGLGNHSCVAQAPPRGGGGELGQPLCLRGPRPWRGAGELAGVVRLEPAPPPEVTTIRWGNAEGPAASPTLIFTLVSGIQHRGDIGMDASPRRGAAPPSGH